MLRIFSKLFCRRNNRRKEHRGAWIHVGSISYGKIEGDIPKWVLSAERRIERKYGGTSSSLPDKVFYLKGRHFEYRISYAGQGGCIVSVERRKR
jgi:hypothetical protein